MTAQLDPGVADLVSYGSAIPGAAKIAGKSAASMLASRLRAARDVMSPQKQVLEEGIDMGRREAMKKIGKTAIAAHTIVGGGKVIDDLLPAIAKHTAAPATKAVAKGISTPFGLFEDFSKYALQTLGKKDLSELGGAAIDDEMAGQIFQTLSKYGDVQPGATERAFNFWGSDDIPEDLLEKYYEQSLGYGEEAIQEAVEKYVATGEIDPGMEWIRYAFDNDEVGNAVYDINNAMGYMSPKLEKALWDR